MDPDSRRKITIHCLAEDAPGPAFGRHFTRQWSRYAPWYFSGEKGARPSAEVCRAAFARHFPAMVPLFDRLCRDLPGDPDRLVRFLSLYGPPPFLTGCSQLAIARQGTHLIRNYDYAPDRFEATVLRTDYLQPVLFLSDCIWGALDGINASGLAIYHLVKLQLAITFDRTGLTMRIADVGMGMV